LAEIFRFAKESFLRGETPAFAVGIGIDTGAGKLAMKDGQSHTVFHHLLEWVPMTKRKPFQLKTIDDLKKELSELGLSLPISEDLSILGRQLSVGAFSLPNRFAVQPMEGFDANAKGEPEELAFRRYRRFAAGGSGLIWFEATAVLPEARSNPHQFWLHEESVDAFARLVEATRREAERVSGRDILCILQITHSGRYSKPEAGKPAPQIVQHSGVLDPTLGLSDDHPLVSDDQLDRLQDTYIETSRLAQKAGFDGVDVKGCHGYLVSELLGAHTREGKYGGSLENRSRFLLETLDRLRQELPDLMPTTRVNAYDAVSYPWGFGVDREDFRRWDLEEPKWLIERLKRLGLPLINVTIGNPYFNPHCNRPYDRAVRGAEPYDEHPLEGVVRFIEIVQEIQQSQPELPMITGGMAWLRHLMPYVAAGAIESGAAALIGQGRGAFAYPESPEEILTQGAMNPAKVCITCSGCTDLMRQGGPTGCVVRDREFYSLK
jgi:2,4-dienoyl-CoA reductase-like NADH-dependent reductase (Old Yellow Enzyme family)